jgi:RNA polymerase sigma-70 factor (ECF subfamily)
LHSAERVARFYLQIARLLQGTRVRYELHQLNGAPALLCWHEGHLFFATWVDCDDGYITAIHSIRHPGKLAHIAAVTKKSPGTSLH